MCTNPILIRNKRFRLSVPTRNQYIKVPCGQCDECLSRRANELYVRAREEFDACLRSGGCGFMCCLTYSDDLLPMFQYEDKSYMVFNKKDVIDFIKRLRTNLDRFFQKHYYKDAPDFKYLVTSEYGTDPVSTHRPHYHLLFFFRSFISYYVFNLCFRSSIFKRVGNNKKIMCFGKIAQCDPLDPARGGIKYSGKYILKDLMYEENRKAIVEKIKFQQNYVNSLYHIVSSPNSAEEEFNNKCIRKSKEYRKAVETFVKPYRHMLQFYMLSNDLGISYIIDKYGESLFHQPSINFDGFPYSVPKLVRKRLESTYGVDQSLRLQKTISMNYINKVLTELVHKNMITSLQKSDLLTFADNYIIPFAGSFYLCNNQDFESFVFNHCQYRPFDDVLFETNFYADNDFFDLRNNLLSCLDLYNSKENLEFRASVAKLAKEKRAEEYIKRKRNNEYKYK